MRQVMLLLVLTSLLLSCGPRPNGVSLNTTSPYDCLFQGVTPTPPVQLPTPTTPEPTATPNACPTRTPWPTALPLPTATTDLRFLGDGSSELRRHTWGPDSERLMGVTAVPSGGMALWYRNPAGDVVIVDPNYPDARINVGTADDIRLAFRPEGGYDLFARRNLQLAWRVAPTLADLPAAAERVLPWGGRDFAVAYGIEGWLYMASAGQIARFNPVSGSWEFSGNYTGEAKQLVRLQSGAMLMLTSSGVFRYAGNDWTLVWDVNSIQTIRNPDGPEYPLGIAVYGNQAAMAWDVPQGFEGGHWMFTEWRVTTSNDGGLTWSGQITVAVPYPRTHPLDTNYTGWYGPAWALFRRDGTLEVTGSYKEVGRGFGDLQDAPLGYPVVVRRINGEGTWCCGIESYQPSPLTGRAEDIQRLGTFLVASVEGNTLIGYEEKEFNGRYDVFSLNR